MNRGVTPFNGSMASGLTDGVRSDPQPSRALGRRTGFTFIELLVTLSIIAISFVPLLNMYAVALQAVDHTDDLTAARYLAQETMERMKNGIATKAQLKRLGTDVWSPPLDAPPRVLNGKHWRTRRTFPLHKDPIEVHVQVFRAESLRASGEGPAKGDAPGGARELVPVVELVTLFEDFDWSLNE